MNKKKTITFIVLLLAVAVGVLVYLQDSYTRDPNSIQIAGNLPLSGPLATYGVAVREGATMAIEDLPKSRPTAPNFSVDWQDNASDPKTAVSVFRKQILSEPDIYTSGVKPQTMAIKDEISQLGIPHFVWIFDAKINQGTDNNFRTWVSYKIEPPIYEAYAEKRKAEKIAITYVRLPHTIEEFEDILIPSFTEKGKELFVEPFDYGRTDFKDIAVKINEFNPDLIILNGFQSELVGLIRSLRPLGAISDGNTIATYDLLDAAKILGPDEIEGIKIVAPVFETRPDQPKIAKWRQRFQDRFGKEPLYTHAFAYDMITAIATAAGDGNPQKSHEEWIAALGGVDTDGVTGPISFDSDGDMLTPLEVGVYRGGKLVPDAADSSQ